MTRTSRRFFAVTALAVPLLAPTLLDAQAAAYQLTLDNDHFTYWLPRAERPDKEYSNGIAIRLPAAPVIASAGALIGDVDACTGLEAPAQACGRASVTFGHQIYTPTPWRPLPGERPYAGWLFSTLEIERVTSERRRQVALEVGITGRESLGEAVQTYVHSKRGYGGPIGWEDQIGFEPAFSVHALESKVLATSSEESALGGSVSGSIGASLGTLRTGGSAGVAFQAGLRPPHPWRSTDHSWAAPSLYVVGGATQHFVARDLMLDGTVFRASPSVERRTLVTEWTAGVGLRVGGVGLEYRGVVRGRQYETQQGSHPYGSFSLSVAH
jgi:lipid A 3-O-deacylase